MEYDRKREEFIGSFGIRIVWIVNSEIHENLDGVIEQIGREILERRERGKWRGEEKPGAS